MRRRYFVTSQWTENFSETEISKKNDEMLYGICFIVRALSVHTKSRHN